jgi:hypothetical protein
MFNPGKLINSSFPVEHSETPDTSAERVERRQGVRDESYRDLISQ